MSLTVQTDEGSLKRDFEINKSVQSKPTRAKFKTSSLPKIQVPKKNNVKRHSFTSGVAVNEDNERNLFIEKSPYVYPTTLEELSHGVMSKAWRKNLLTKENKQKPYTRKNYRLRQNVDMLNRLYVKEAPIPKEKTILDVDPHFFSTVAKHTKVKYTTKDYVQKTRDMLKTKITIGYREDEIHMIEEGIRMEQKTLNKIVKNYKYYVTTFEAFLYKNYMQASSVLRNSEKETEKSIQKCKQFLDLNKRFAELRTWVYSLEDRWQNCKLYQKFLYLISPISWRTNFDYYFKASNTVVSFFKAEDTNMFKQHRSKSIHSLEHLIDEFFSEITTQEDPMLYFETPKQLNNILYFIEIQNLNSMIHSEDLAIPLSTVCDNIEYLKEAFNKEVANIKESIEKLLDGISYEETRANLLEDLAIRLVNEDFKWLVAAPENLSLYAFVENLYETSILPNDAKYDVYRMFEQIEKKYHKALLRMDSLPNYAVHNCEVVCYEEEARIFKIAQEAEVKFGQCIKLNKQVARMLGKNITKRVGKELKWRSPPKDIKIPPPVPPRELTEEELDELLYFTNYCEHSDNLKDYGIVLTATPKSSF